jgi:hypothetical protein
MQAAPDPKKEPVVNTVAEQKKKRGRKPKPKDPEANKIKIKTGPFCVSFS